MEIEMLYMDEYGNVKPKGSGRGGFLGSRGANRGRGRGRGQYSDAMDYMQTRGLQVKLLPKEVPWLHS